MKNIFVILKKELKRFFTDRRMLLSMFLPGILIYGVYTLMGNLFKSDVFSTKTKDTTYQIAYTNNYSSDTTKLPKLLSYIDGYFATDESNNKVEFTKVAADTFTTSIEKLKNNEYHLVVQFTEGFEDKLMDNTAKNGINLYYNGEKKASENIYSIANNLIPVAYNNYKQNFDYGTNTAIVADVGTKNAMMGQILSFILPMVTVSLLYSTVLSFCPESIAGEKERGTLASILLTPIKRSEFVIGKILGLSVVVALSGTCSFVGLVASLPNLIGVSTLPFSVIDMILLFIIIISTMLVFVGFGVLLSSFANTVKEAMSYLGPLSVLIMVLSMVPSLLNLSSIGFAFVPIINLSACISALMAASTNVALFFGITAISNIVYTGIMIFLATQLFKKEKVVLGQ